MYFSITLKKFSEPIHHVGFMFHKGMGVAVERDGRVFMPQNFGQGLYVHSAFQRARGKGVPQGMEALMQDIQTL